MVPKVPLLLDSGLQFSTFSSRPPPQSHTNPPVTWATTVPEAKKVKCRKSLALIRKGFVLTPLVPLSLVFSSNISIHSKIERLQETGLCLRTGRDMSPDPERLAP